MQVLEPTGGEILRPRDWFYAEGHRGPTYMWTISREDTAGGRPYTTGVRIQLLTGVRNGTGKTAERVTIAGTTKELWETYTAAFDAMRDFELIDMQRFAK
jgi:hypothetical protein